jgi:hypothetical protein
MASQADYEKAMANRYATTRVGTGRNDYGYTGIPSNQARGYQPTKKKGGGWDLSRLGGLTGRKSYAGFSEDDLKRQLEYDKAIWERSTPDVTGVGGTVRWDRDKNMVTSALSAENQAIYDAMYARQKGWGEDVDAYSGDWRDIQQQRFTDKLGLYAEGDAREEAIRRARQHATGASTTGIFSEDAKVAALTNQRNRELEEAAFNESQGLIDSSITRQFGDIGMMSDLGKIANSMIVTPTPDTQGNMANVSTASTNWADALAMDALKKQQGKSKFWNSILGGISGGMFT